MTRIAQALIAFGAALRGTLMALVIQLGAPILTLYLVLTVPPLFGCVSYSDRPGPGCYGLSSRLGLWEFGHHAAAMVSYALFAAQFLWLGAFLCILLALLTKWRPRTRWVRSLLLGIVGFIGTGYLTAAAGWYIALSDTGALVVAMVGGAVAALLIPRLITPRQRSDRPLDRLTSVRLGIVLCVLLASAGCVYNAVRMQTRTLPARNPTVYHFELPLEDLRARVMAGLTRDAQRKNPIFGRPKWRWSPANLDVAVAEQYKTWLKVLELPGNDRDLYLSNSHEPLWESPVYLGPHDGLPFLAEFHVHFAATSPTLTSVSVTALETKVLNGQMTGMIGHGRANRYVRVAPTSIEEYVVLRYIGDILGVRSMPKVILPAP